MELLDETLEPTDPFATSTSSAPTEVVGRPAILELLYTGVPVRRLLQGALQVTSRTIIFQTLQSATYKQVDALPLPTRPYTVWKAHHKLNTLPGSVTTIVHVDMGGVPQEELGRFIDNGTRIAKQALATLVTAYDERIAYRMITSQLWIPFERGRYLFDMTQGIRFFQSSPEWDVVDETLESTLGKLPEDYDDATKNALECYLAALSQRVTPVGFIVLAAALDVLCPGRRNRFNLNNIKNELNDLGVTYRDQEIVDIVAVRGDITHKGLRQHEKLARSWPALERLVRDVLRKRLGIESRWPVTVAESQDEPYDQFDFEDTAIGPPSQDGARGLLKLLQDRRL